MTKTNESDSVQNALRQALEATARGQEMEGANIALVYLISRRDNDVKILATKACPSQIDEVGYLEMFKHLAQQDIVSDGRDAGPKDNYLINLSDKNMLVS